MLDFSVKVYAHKATTTHNSMFSYWVSTWTGRVKNLRFSTKNPGGFSECSFSLDCPYAEAMDIYESYHHNYIELESGGGETIWHGRIHEITPEPGQVSIVAYGLWSHTFDTVYDTGYFIQTPGAENPITNLTEYVPLSNTKQMYAQSFQLSEARAIQDIQLRLANFGVPEGSVVFELCSDSAGVPGTVLESRSMEVSALDSDGLSEFLGLTSDYRLSASTTYWIRLRGSGDYFANVANLTGAHDGGNGVTYLIDNGVDFMSSGVSTGTYVTNTTDTVSAPVIDIDLDNLANPNETVWHLDDTSWISMPNVTDDTPGTVHSFPSFNYEEDYIVIGDDAQFGGAYITIGTAQTSPTEVRVEYLTDDSWHSLDTVIDETAVSGVSLAQNGAIRWKFPASDWATDQSGGSNNTAYWVRLSFTGPLSSFTIAEVDIGVNSKLSFTSMTFDTSDGYSIDVAVCLGIDTNASYSSGKLRYYSGGSWADYSPSADAIFYIWQHQKFNYSTGAASTALDVILDAISYCALLDEDYTIAMDTGIATINPISFNSGEKPGDVMELVSSYGSSGSSPEPMFIGLYEDRGLSHNGPVLHFRKMSSGRKWYMDISDLAFGQQGLSMSASLDGMRTRTAVIYSDSVGSRSATTWILSDEYYERFGYHRDGLFSIAGASESVADLIAEVVADTYGRPQSKLSLLVDGVIKDQGMNRWPIWSVRAGDVLKIRNLFPSSSTLDAATVDGLSTIYIQETEYDAGTGRMTITPSDMSKSLLDVILALAGLSGGSLV